ncbi:MAG: magnesium-translocating P-type ATPase [Legionellales bacterium]|nr:magnesium-translocating P-type ATPase [Legionellales bacterium]
MNIFKVLYLNYRRRQRRSRLFQRSTILEMFKGRNKPPVELPSSVMTSFQKNAQLDFDTLALEFETSATGLSEQEVADKLKIAGINEVALAKPTRWWTHLWHCYKNPFNLLLSVLAVLSFYTGDQKGTIVILTMVFLSTSMRFWQEMRANQAAEKLQALVSNTVTVLRKNVSSSEKLPLLKFEETDFRQNLNKIEVPIKHIVPGEIVFLSAGDMIPADLRLLWAKDLFINQAAMTGEALPVEKFAHQKNINIQNPFELDNILFMGTNVVSGSAIAMALNTGNQTYLGVLAQHVSRAEPTPTGFQKGVNNVSWLMIRFMLVMTPIVFLLNGFTKGDWLQAFLFSVSIAVGLTPEMLPMIVTSTLAKGAVSLSRKKVIVKRLDAIQNLGAMNILCADKTGTLTQDKIFLDRYIDIFGEESLQVLEFAYLNSVHQTGLKNLLDRAVLEHVEVHVDLAKGKFRKVDEIPFDFQRRRMSVVVAHNGDDPILICKGALEEVLKVCTTVQAGNTVEPLTESIMTQISRITAELNDDGLRIVAVAIKNISAKKPSYDLDDESNLTLLGYIAFLDPPKESTVAALQALNAHGILVKILTGDNERVTRKICREVGIDTDVGGIVLGSDIEFMTDEELTLQAKTANVFAKLTPLHKERIVRILRADDNVVGFIGDGINDAPALRAADIGISVDTAVDIAKEAADIILLEKSLMVLERAVVEGRKTFANMLKYIKMTASSNFGNVFSVLVAGAFLPFLPMLPLQLLVQNLLYDISQLSIPFDNVDPELLKTPQHWHPNRIGWFMVYFGPISSIFDILTFILLWFYFGANSVAHQTFFQSGWFVEGLLSQTLIVHMIRTRKIPFIQSRASWPVLLTTIGVVIVGVIIPMSQFAPAFKMQALPLSYFPFLLVILIAYMVLTQWMKGFYVKRFNWQ